MDELVLRRARKGDTAAFEQLITPHEQLVWRVCWHYTHHQEDARDCAQEAMVKAWRSLPHYRQDCSLETWLYRIAASCCIDFLRRKKRTTSDSTDQLAEAGFDPADPSPQPEETAIRQDEKRQLREALDLLPEDMRTALILSAVEGRKYEEIAAITGVAAGTVKSRINRARQKLAEILSRREQSGSSAVQPFERRST
ncbi:MAG: sigma-70 family RNA polymerase sigma factor [Clostridia bacterium]|nr:sigma-70 family RNA polymerase sigma factor [Clostridia bacterium]